MLNGVALALFIIGVYANCVPYLSFSDSSYLLSCSLYLTNNLTLLK